MKPRRTLEPQREREPRPGDILFTIEDLRRGLSDETWRQIDAALGPTSRRAVGEIVARAKSKVTA
jgi:hypothetical protein